MLVALGKLGLTFRILMGMLAGLVLGLAFMFGSLPAALAPLVTLLGDLFLQLLKLTIVPLILASMVCGVVSMGDVRSMGRIGTQTLLFYLLTVLIAVAIGLVLVNTIQPGRGLGYLIAGTAAQQAPAGPSPTWIDLILRLVPENPFKAMAEMDVLGIVVFSLLLGMALLSLGQERAAPLTRFFQALNDAVMRLTEWVMALAPVGVGALMVKLLASQKPETLGPMLKALLLYCLCVILGLALHFGVYLLLIWRMGRVHPFLFTRQCFDLLATAFGTASSNATLPVTFRCMERAGVSRKIAGFVLPIGATANMDGTALYEAVAAVFIAQAYGIALPLEKQVIIAFTAILAAVGAAGIPSAGLVTMSLVLTAAHLPLAGIALLLSVDRILDMLRTMVNVMGDAVACRVIQTWNPTIDEEQLPDPKPLAEIA